MGQGKVPPKAVPLDVSVVPEVSTKVKALNENQSVGGNRQFRVTGESLHLNRAVTSLCDEMSRGVSELLGEKESDGGFYPINVILYSKGNAEKNHVFKVSVTQPAEGGFKINLVVDIREQIDRSDLEAGVMQVLIMERTLRTDPTLNADSVLAVPRWLSDGMLGVLQWKKGNRNRGMYEVLNRKPDLFPVGSLLTQKRADILAMGETVKALYKASATAMVMSLSRQEGGKSGLSSMLSQVAVFEGEPTELLRRNFADLNVGKRGLQKMWNLQLAEMSVPRLIDTETLVATEEKLRDILFLRLSDDRGVERRVEMKDFDVLAGVEKDVRVKVTMRLRQDLVQLSYRAYPDYQPVLAEYGFILTSLAKGNMEGVRERLASLIAERDAMYAVGQRTRDVLDWYQIKQVRNVTGDFKGYQRLLMRMKREKKQSESNLVSRYLSQMEALMTRGSK